MTTLAAAEQLYDAIYVWKRQGYLEITKVSLDFFNQFGTQYKVGKYKAGSSTYKKIISTVSTYADGFFEMVAENTPADGRLHEQYSGWNGTAVSARDLTWSYASFITAKAAREGKVPDSWAAKSISVPRGKCQFGPEHDVQNDIISVKFSAADTSITGFGTVS